MSTQSPSCLLKQKFANNVSLFPEEIPNFSSVCADTPIGGYLAIYPVLVAWLLSSISSSLRLAIPKRLPTLFQIKQVSASITLKVTDLENLPDAGTYPL